VLYHDGKTFDYFGVAFSTFRALVRSKHIGSDWLKLRSQYKYSEVKS
jgi:hypothetical protein